jgi:hypothetical protein
VNVEELRAMAERANEREGGAMVLTVPKKRPPKGETCALLPGLNGRILATDGERVTLLVRAPAVLAWLDRRAALSPHPPKVTP